MPLIHCKKCMHEWEGLTDNCDWCGAEEFYILEEYTPFERWLLDKPKEDE